MKCFTCGGVDWGENLVLWDELIEEWELELFEVTYINHQQGFYCINCQNNLRANVIAKSLVEKFDNSNTLAEAAFDPKFKDVTILEVNRCHNLTSYLERFPRHMLIEYPHYDIQDLDLNDNQWDIVVHSDTLEHVDNPLKALEECRRILKSDGQLIFTTPIRISRLSKSRKGLKNSYHGSRSSFDPGMLVHTEFGVDIWRMVAEAGFTKIEFNTLDFPAGIAILASS